MGTLHRLAFPPLAAGPAHDAEPACLQGRRCHGTCTCAARAIQGHGRDCDGACEGGCIDGVQPCHQASDIAFDFDAFDRLCARFVLIGFIAWCLALAICTGAIVAWLWPGLLAAVRQ